MEESFVDEELWIGSESIGEYAKRMLKQTSSAAIGPGERRKTFAGSSETGTVPPDVFASGAFFDDFSLSKASYYTPDATTISETNGTFINEVEAILNEPTSKDTTYATAHDHTQPVDIDNIEEKIQELVIISDDELDDDFLRYQGTQIKYEDITLDDDDDVQQVEDISEEPAILEDSREDSLDMESVDNSTATFDDTLEDMENFLKYGHNYEEKSEQQMQKHEVVKEMNCVSYEQTDDCFKVPDPKLATPLRRLVTPVKSGIPRKANWQPIKTFDNIISPVSNYINTGPGSAPRKKYFKSPEPPPSPLLSMPKSDKYKDIVSPIGVYIKKSTCAPINRSVQARKLAKVLPESLFEDETLVLIIDHLILPDIMYKPAEIRRESALVEVKLPSNIKVLTPLVVDAFVTKHVARYYQRDREDHALRLQQDQDLTLNCSDVEDGKENISVLNLKRCI